MEYLVEDDRIKTVRIGDQEIDFDGKIDLETFKEDDVKEYLEKVEEYLESANGDAVDEWEKVYSACKDRGKIVLVGIAEENGEAPYPVLEKKLEDEGYEIRGRTFAGIFRGINGHIVDHISAVENSSEARDFLKQESRSDGKYRILENEDYLKGLKQAVL